MSYTKNPYMPRLRRDVAGYARWHGVRAASRHFGFPPGTVSKWCKKATKLGFHPIPTRSSRPHHHPKQLTREVVDKIIEVRQATKRTSEVVHEHLRLMGIKVSLNSVRRTIDHFGLMKKRSHLKRWHPPVPRPIPLKQGDLVEIDAIHIMTGKKTRIYVLVLIDVYSRWVYAKAYEKLNAITAVSFVAEAEAKASFHFSMIQSDHGPEFSNWFVGRIRKNHRYTRIGKPNDNAHIERVNRTLQEECLDKAERTVDSLNCTLKKYLPYYNYERLHLGLNLKTPSQLFN
jgi:transposase InsO family protein